ncbi:hypothetical protein IF2G_07229 [Cordyceps javanica]|nr:hypothetical protein IF2G_07229 [Cordyceps javanica]
MACFVLLNAVFLKTNDLTETPCVTGFGHGCSCPKASVSTVAWNQIVFFDKSAIKVSKEEDVLGELPDVLEPACSRSVYRVVGVL